MDTTRDMYKLLYIVHNTASPLHHASVRQRTIGSNKPLVMLPNVRTSVFQFLWARDGDTMKSKKEYFCGIWNRIFKCEDLRLKAQNSCFVYQLYVSVRSYQ